MLPLGSGRDTVARMRQRLPRSGRETGQAAVESALVLPLFVFLILGIIQLGLMHQARLLTKYAAYRAVRAGSINGADPDKMKSAAIAALLPVIARGHSVTKTAGASNFLQKWFIHRVGLQGKVADYPVMDNVRVDICGPLQNQVGGGQEMDFDDPKNSFPDTPNWATAQVTKLKAQVLLNYQLIIPFANTVIHGIYTNMGTNPVLRLGKTGKDETGGIKHTDYLVPAMMGVYLIPIRATYTMRMQSNLYKNKLPTSSQCKFSFKY
ncbi:MAG: TadE/TadG family type IV pilus assembly protein [Myxococcaceae bacterium]